MDNNELATRFLAIMERFDLGKMDEMDFVDEMATLHAEYQHANNEDYDIKLIAKRQAEISQLMHLAPVHLVPDMSL